MTSTSSITRAITFSIALIATGIVCYKFFKKFKFMFDNDSLYFLLGFCFIAVVELFLSSYFLGFLDLSKTRYL